MVKLESTLQTSGLYVVLNFPPTQSSLSRFAESLGHLPECVFMHGDLDYAVKLLTKESGEEKAKETVNVLFFINNERLWPSN
jgi:hypothetical protein